MTRSFSIFSDLKSQLEEKQARVATVGLGYVGLPLALTVHDAGFRATGFDINSRRVAQINAGERVISYFAESRVSDAVASGCFDATGDMARLAGMDVILICVPTPLDGNRAPNLEHVISATETIAKTLRAGQLIVLESTVWPGATATVVRPILERSGMKAGIHFFLGFSPEREDPGNADYSTRTIPKIVGADDPLSLELIELLYSHIVTTPVPVGSTATAEAVKLAENTFRNVNIALANEMKSAFIEMGVDIWEVVQAAATKPFGYMPFYPGPGIGGDCIPVSPELLSWRARDVGAETPLIDLACRSSAQEPARIVERLSAALSGGLAGKRILMLGVSYKRDVEDSRESPALEILQRIEAENAICDYHDPLFEIFPATRDHPDLAGRRSTPLEAASISGYDAVLVIGILLGVAVFALYFWLMLRNRLDTLQRLIADREPLVPPREGSS
ncbi:MAG: nucleotide sugar dehydrogenase [Halocynthiibacter sp.]